MKRVLLLPLLALLIVFVAACTGPEKQTTELAEGRINFADGTYMVDTKGSTLYWEAYKLVGGHTGGISLKSGELIVQNGQPQSGSFVIDMDSITDTDLENESMRTGLINHLKSDDFFSTATYPMARFDITRIQPYEGEGDYNYQIDGDLSIRDVTDTITLYAKIEGFEGKLLARGRAEVDRTKYNITIRSGSFFEDLGDQLIKDVFVLEMDLMTDRLKESL